MPEIAESIIAWLNPWLEYMSGRPWDEIFKWMAVIGFVVVLVVGGLWILSKRISFIGIKFKP